MACITVSVDNLLKARMESFPWVNWSEVGREEAMKREILERYISGEELSSEDWEFCDRIDWIPGDELQVRQEYLDKLDKIAKGPHSKMTLDDLDELLE
jgi:hypothetical protein